MTTFFADRSLSTFPVHKTGGGALCAAYGTIEIGTNPIAADVYRMCRVPAGAVVLSGWLYGDDIDTGTESLDMDIGWLGNGVEATDADGFGNLGVLTGDAFALGNVSAVTNLMYPLQGVLLTDGPVVFTKETIIAVTTNVTAAAGGTGTLSVVVYYVVP